MTKWDRAIDNESDLRYLSDLFNTTDISKMDLFNLLKTVTRFNFLLYFLKYNLCCSRPNKFIDICRLLRLAVTWF